MKSLLALTDIHEHYYTCLRAKENDESFIYQNIGSNISILGGKARGTMYGVMTFLERELGCRWYTLK